MASPKQTYRVSVAVGRTGAEEMFDVINRQPADQEAGAFFSTYCARIPPLVQANGSGRILGADGPITKGLIDFAAIGERDPRAAQAFALSTVGLD